MCAQAIWLAVAIAAQAPTEIPEDWKRDLRAAASALEARDFARAEALLVQVARASQELDDNDPRQIAPLVRLALFYLTDEVGRPAEAEPLLRRVVTVQEQTVGRESPELAETLILLAACRLKVDSKADEQAEQLDQRALAITEKAYGKDDLRTAAVLHNLATTHLERKQYDHAKRVLERAIAIREKAHVPNDLKLAELLDDLGDLHFLLIFNVELPPLNAFASRPLPNVHERPDQQLERYGRLANSYYLRALAIREKALGPDAEVIAERLKNVALSAAFSGRPADVESYFARWLAIYERTKREPCEEQAGILCECGGAAVEQRHWQDAERWYTRAQSVVEQLKGGKSPEFAFVLKLRAEVATEDARFADAESLLKRGLAIQSELVGPGSVCVRQVRDVMGGRYQDHASDRKAYRFWATLSALEEHLRDPAVDQGGLADIVEAYDKLLRRTNRVVPRPHDADLAYLNKIGAVTFRAGCDDLLTLKTFDIPLTLDDQALPHIARLYCLEEIKVRSGGLSDQNIACLQNMESLRELDLSVSQMTDAGLENIAKLAATKRLDLRGTSITDAGLAHLGSLANLRSLVVSFTPIGDASLETIARLGELEELRLDFTRVTDAGLIHLTSLKNLRSLVLTSTGITDAGLERIKSLPALTQLNVCMTSVSPAAVERLKRERPGLTIVHGPPLETPRRQKSNIVAREAPTPPTPLIFPMTPQQFPLPSLSAAKPR